MDNKNNTAANNTWNIMCNVTTKERILYL